MKVNFTFHGPQEPGRLLRNLETNKARGYPPVGPATGHSLAIVGGGRSARMLPRAWDGEVWALNGAWRWLGWPEAVFFSGDWDPSVADIARGAGRAILCSTCDPSVFDVVEQVEMFGPDDPVVGTSGCAATVLAMLAGWPEIVLFGCECSFPENSRTHIYGDTGEEDNIILVRHGGQNFMTLPYLLWQASTLGPIIRQSGGRVHERSGGLLRSMVEHDEEYEVLAGTPSLVASAVYEEAAE